MLIYGYVVINRCGVFLLPPGWLYYWWLAVAGHVLQHAKELIIEFSRLNVVIGNFNSTLFVNSSDNRVESDGAGSLPSSWKSVAKMSPMTINHGVENCSPVRVIVVCVASYSYLVSFFHPIKKRCTS